MSSQQEDRRFGDAQPTPMQTMKVEWPEIPRREITPEESVRIVLDYIRRRYLDSGKPGSCR